MRCPEEVVAVHGYDFRNGEDGVGYYRRDDAPPPDEKEYMRVVLQRASAAGAVFIGCPEEVQPLVGYMFRDGADGRGYYMIDPPPAQPLPPPAQPPAPAAPKASYDAFLDEMKELGAM